MSDIEARRQQALIAALITPRTDAAEAAEAAEAAGCAHGRRAQQGLAAYRANAAASAERALATAFGSIQAMLGADDFKHLAREFWRAQPPLRGDLAEWGTTFPAWLEAHAGLARWPYLADCARLDLARHDCERAADASLDASSLALLESTDSAELRLLMMPGLALLRSRWPIAAIHAAHQPATAGDSAFAAVRAALAEGRADTVLVARRGWRAEVHLVSEHGARWTEDLLAGLSLAAALDRAGEAFDFAAWLAAALRETWLKGVAVSSD